MKKIEDIEKLRGLACILVFIQHMVWICPFVFLSDVLPKAFQHGSGGVAIFFAISGFVITLSLRDKLANVVGDTFLERVRSSTATISLFYKKRFLRVMPVMLTVWCVLGIFFLCSEKDANWLIPFLRVPFEVVSGIYPYIVENFVEYGKVHLYGMGPFWTLAVEIQFYIAWPIVMLLCKNDNIRAIVSLLCGALFLIVVQPLAIGFYGFKYYALYNNIPALFFGSFFAMIFDAKKEYNVKNKLAVIFGMLASFIAVWCFNSILPEENFFTHTIEAIFAILMLVLAVFANGKFEIPVITKILLFLGRRSYSFYAVQLTAATIVTWFIHSIYFPIKNSTPFLQFIVLLVVLSLVTEIVYNCIEKPSRKLG